MTQFSALVVDDDLNSAQIVARLLRGIIPDVEVFTSSDGSDALYDVIRRKFDLIVVDDNMPGMRGLELFNIIRTKSNRNQATSFLFVTAHIDTVKEHIAAYDDVSALPKPLDGGALKKSLATLNLNLQKLDQETSAS